MPWIHAAGFPEPGLQKTALGAAANGAAASSAGLIPARPRRRNRLGRRFLPVLAAGIVASVAAARQRLRQQPAPSKQAICFDLPRLRRRARFLGFLSKRPSGNRTGFPADACAGSPCGPGPFLAGPAVPFEHLATTRRPSIRRVDAPLSGSFKILSFERRANHQGRKQDAF